MVRAFFFFCQFHMTDISTELMVGSWKRWQQLVVGTSCRDTTFLLEYTCNRKKNVNVDGL